MSTNVDGPTGQTAASLLSGILVDLQCLVGQQLQLTLREVEDELREQGAAATVFGIGVGVLFLDAIVGCLALTHLLHWVTSPPGTDPAQLPLWACHAVVALVLTLIGGVLTTVGRVRFKSNEQFRSPCTEIQQEHVP